MFSISLLGGLALAIAPLASAQSSCNPLISGVGRCAPNSGLPSSTYSVDFTKETALPKHWILSNYATVDYGSNGAEFTFAKRYDAPQIWTDFYMLFGKVETVMQVAPGQGIISSSVLISDDLDEIDWEFSGNDFGQASGKGQNNFYGKGVTGAYDRGQFFDVASPQSAFHTYTVDWSPDHIIWSVDANVVRTLLAEDCDDGSHQFPQSPSRLQLGIWDGGDADTGPGTVSWAGGYTNLSQVPFTMYVKSVSISNNNPANAYNYTDTSGNWKSIKLIQKSVSSSSTVSSTTNVPLASLASNAISSAISAVSSSLASLGTHFAGSSATPPLTESIASLSVTSIPATLTSASSVSRINMSSPSSEGASSRFTFFPNTSSSAVLTSHVSIVPTLTMTSSTPSDSHLPLSSSAVTTRASDLPSSNGDILSTPTSASSTSITSDLPSSANALTTNTDSSISVSFTTPMLVSAISIVPVSTTELSSSLNSSQTEYSLQSTSTEFLSSETATVEPSTGISFLQNTSLAVSDGQATTSVISTSTLDLTQPSTQNPMTTTQAMLATGTPSLNLPNATSTQSSASRVAPFPWTIILQALLIKVGRNVISW